MAPSDYYLFSKLQKHLRGKKFDDEEEVKTDVMEHFADKEPEYFLKGIELLILSLDIPVVYVTVK